MKFQNQTSESRRVIKTTFTLEALLNFRASSCFTALVIARKLNCLLGKTQVTMQRDCSAVTSVCMFLSGISIWLGVKRYSLSVVQLQCCHSRDKRHEAIVVEQQSDHRQNDLVSLSANVPQDVCCWCWDGLKKEKKKKSEKTTISDLCIVSMWNFLIRICFDLKLLSHLHIWGFEQQGAEWRVAGRWQHCVFYVGQLQTQGS